MAITEATRTPLRKARDNPFAVDRVLQIRYRLEAESLDNLAERLETLNWRAAIVGPEGTGKTTLLEDLSRHLVAQQGWRIRGARLSVEHPQFDRQWLHKFFAELGPHDIIAFDGAEQLSPRAWRSFLKRSRHAGGLIITSHRPALLPTLLETRTSPAVLDFILDQLMPDMPLALREEAERLFQIHHGNIRDVLRALYDRWSSGELHCM
jgi:hypothetical protein